MWAEGRRRTTTGKAARTLFKVVCSSLPFILPNSGSASPKLKTIDEPLIWTYAPCVRVAYTFMMEPAT